jgi:excinuclease ABC subunit C
MQNREYRRYNIEGITPGDDYAAMRQVLTRRYGRPGLGREADAPLPPARRLGGGRQDAEAPARAKVGGGGSARACPTWCWSTAARARSVDGARGVRELGLDLSLIVGVEKGEGRKVGLEELVFADGREKVYLGRIRRR